MFTIANWADEFNELIGNEFIRLPNVAPIGIPMGPELKRIFEVSGVRPKWRTPVACGPQAASEAAAAER
jgi:hypothetical protein